MDEVESKAPTHAVWQVVATGGWWKPREIAEELGTTPRQVHDALQSMSRHRQLVKRVIPREQRVRLKGRGASERVQYCVDFDCVVPAGLTAKQVLEALKGTST